MAQSKAAKVEFTCQGCAHREARWLGRCPACGAWNSLVEEISVPAGPAALRSLSGAGSARGVPVPITSVSLQSSARSSTGVGELDRVLGGGLVPGAAILLGGEPGVGKSTLLLSAMDRLSRRGPALYISGEESLAQIRMRAERLGTLSPSLLLLAENDLGASLEAAERSQPTVLAIDSVQTLFSPSLGSVPGSVAQVREVAAQLIAWAKRTGTPLLLVGHVTKDGSLAGPRLLEHAVDTVLSFEGDRNHAYRLLRARKNRFGSTSELGVFEMKSEGLCEVPNASALFLAERPQKASGSAVAATLNGSRPLLVEVQALVAASCGQGSPRRSAVGVDAARTALLLAVLEKKEGLVLSDQDVFVNAAGGAELDEPACDLAIAAALCSSFRNTALAPDLLVLGEVGLAGEVRAVSQAEQRLSEAAQLGFGRCVLPLGNARRIARPPLELLPVSTLGEALGHLFG